MCITASVGRDAHNDVLDVRCVQRLLNLNAAAIGLAAPLGVDGKCGPATVDALSAWQQVAGVAATGRLEPGDGGMAAFRRAFTGAFTPPVLAGVMAAAAAPVLERYFPAIAASLRRFGIDTPRRVAHFLAQVGHESGDLRYQEEIADGYAYEGRKDLGNTQPGDGPRFKGRGLIQLTGRANYEKFGAAIGRDLVSGDNPGLVASDPQLAVDVAGWFWSTRGLNTLADADDLSGITRRVNGGLNGLADRQTHLDRGRWFLAL